jgi:hypothetical protein
MQEHLVPYVESAVVKLAADKYLVDKIAIQVRFYATSRVFRGRVSATIRDSELS